MRLCRFAVRYSPFLYLRANLFVTFCSDIDAHGGPSATTPPCALHVDDWGVVAIDFDHRTGKLLTVGENAMQVWNLSTFTCEMRAMAPPLPQTVYSRLGTEKIKHAKFIDSSRILVAQSTTLSVLDARNGRVMHQMQTPDPGISYFEIIAGRYAACAMSVPGLKYSSTVVFDLVDRRLVRELGGHIEGVNHLAIVADHLVTVGKEGMIKIWRAMEAKSPQIIKHEETLRTRPLMILALLGLLDIKGDWAPRLIKR